MAKERYEALRVHREQFLQRSRHNAMLTIPSLMPLDGHDGKSHLIEPYQSLGALGVVSMSSRITMALIPAGRPHLRLGIPPHQLLQMQGEVPPELNRQLAKSEQLVAAAVERANWRQSTLEIMQQLMVAGSLVVEFLDDQTLRLHRLDNFVWRRDVRGKVLECVIRELWDKDALPADVPRPPTDGNTMGYGASTDDDVPVYIHIKWDNAESKYAIQRYTEKNDRIGESESFSARELPWLFLRWSSTPGEDYGRSKVEEVVGDLRSYDSLSKQALEQAAMGATNFVMVRPGATANGLRNRLSRMTNGDIVVGDPDSVDVKQFANGPGFQITEASLQKLEERLSRAFLLLSTQQRNAERVTATEIERDIQELESTLGGTFSSLSLEFLEKLTDLLMVDMKAKGEFPPVGDDELQTTILTGLEALSRERDVGRGVQAAQIASQFGEMGIQQLKLDVILDKIMTGLGFPDAIKSQEQIQQEQQAAQAAQLAQQAVGPAIQAAAQAEGGGENVPTR
jgi:hypothetical protein